MGHFIPLSCDSQSLQRRLQNSSYGDQSHYLARFVHISLKSCILVHYPNPLPKPTTMLRLRIFLLIACTLCLASSLHAQTTKKQLDHDVYEIWNRINEQAISPNAEWILYSMSPENGDAVLHIKQTDGDVEYVISRGVSAQFSVDSHHAFALIKPPKDSVRHAKRNDVKPDHMPKDSLVIIELNSGSITYIERVNSFSTPAEAGGWIAYHLEKPLNIKDSESANSESAEEEKDEKKKKDEGAPLILENLISGESWTFEDATAYQFSENGEWFAYTVSSESGDNDGVFAVSTGTGEVFPVMTGIGSYKNPTFDKAAARLAFLSNQEDHEADQPAFTLYHWSTDSNDLVTLANETTPGIPEGWWVSEHGDLSFSEESSRLLFGTAPKPLAEKEDDDVLEDEEVKLDIWHWKDPLLQPMQLVQLENEKKRSYSAVVHLEDMRVVQLADEAIPDITIGKKGEAAVALGSTNMPYRKLISWESPRFHDTYLIDVATGERQLILEQIQAAPALSPNAEFVTWWDRAERAMYAQSVEGGEAINLTSRIPYPVYYEKHDWPYLPNSYGSAGWVENDMLFLIYDKHDIWALDPTGEALPINLTEGLGRDSNLRLRYLDLDPDEDAIPADAPILLSAFNYTTKSSGFYSDQIGVSSHPKQLIMTDQRLGSPAKAKNADRLLLTRESYVEFPNLWVSTLELDDMKQMSDANPQQSEYQWGTAELVEWVSLDGIPLQGILYKPDNFDPAQKYPMMVYFYEKMSDGFHNHRPPATARSSISFSFYASRGYLVFVPDIPYRIGYPGESALHAVVPGVTSLMEKGFVDEDHIGVQGHSWGGYQIAYMVTETNLFKAAEAGAPVSNMTSAYGGIRWASGMSRMFQYEESQSRIGGTLWEYPLRYIDNSPLFQADKIQTPLLMMHNDADGAVPWYQGIELFVAMRRLDKPVWMLNYNGEAHGLQKYHNKRDWAIRMQQFFDHYLKGAPAPVWMEEGVPALQKGKTLGLELISPNLEVVTEEP